MLRSNQEPQLLKPMHLRPHAPQHETPPGESTTTRARPTASHGDREQPIINKYIILTERARASQLPEALCLPAPSVCLSPCLSDGRVGSAPGLSGAPKSFIPLPSYLLAGRALSVHSSIFLLWDSSEAPAHPLVPSGRYLQADGTSRAAWGASAEDAARLRSRGPSQSPPSRPGTLHTHSHQSLAFAPCGHGDLLAQSPCWL